MEEIKRPSMHRAPVPRGSRRSVMSPAYRPQHQRLSAHHLEAGSAGAQNTSHQVVHISLRFSKPRLPRFRTSQRFRQYFAFLNNIGVRLSFGCLAIIVVVAEIITIVQPLFIQHTYALGSADSVLRHVDKLLASKLNHDIKQADFEFNAGYTPGAANNQTSGGGPKISATVYEDPAKGMDVMDPINNLDFMIKPQFSVLSGRQDGNRVIYPLSDGTGWMVYTMQASSIKEDILLRHANGDKMVLNYSLGLGDSYSAHMQQDGSVGIYGSSLPISGKVSTGTPKDTQLLQKARQKAPKDKLFYVIPAPVIHGVAGKQSSNVQARYELNSTGTRLTVVTTGLRHGTYPLSVDPTVTVTSTTDLFRDTNPESNIDFNGTTGNISRGAVTGGVIPAWTTNTNNLATARFLSAATINDDYAYVAGGVAANGTANLTSIEFARLSSSNSSIGSWSTTTSLPTALSRFRLLAYNGYLYAIGGSTTDTTCATASAVVYYNRIQANGQLSATWSNTSGTSNLPSAVCGLGAFAYNGKMYAVGGRTGSANTTGVTTVAYANVNPDGSLGSWTTSSVALPASRYDLNLQIYNNYLYVVGGTLNAGTLTNTTLYASIASDGSIYGSGSANWLSTSSFTTARSNMGSSFTAANDGFMYLEGGCSVYNASQECTTIQGDVQIAQINADGSLGTWSTDAQATLSVVGGSIAAWRGTMYSFAGCTSMTTSGPISCLTGAPTLNTQSYSAISGAGQVGPLNTGTALPTAIYEHGAAVNNGFIYVVGGCITNTCQTGTGDTTGNTSFAPLNADGTIGAWTTDSTHILNSAGIGGATGLAAFGFTVYNNFLYVAGGYTSGGPSSNVYYVQLNTNGTLAGNWTLQASKLGASTYSDAAIAYRGFLLVFGGCTGTVGSAGCSSYRNTNYEMPIGAAGAPGTLTTSAATGSFLNLPTATALMGPAVYNGYIYLAGGANGSSGQTNTILYAKIADNGNITSWSTATGVMSHTLRRTDAYAMNGYLYVTGGHDGSTNTTYGTIQIGQIRLSDGNIPNNLTTSVTTITPRWDERTVFANGYIYATGGCSTGNPPGSCSTRSTLDEYVEEYNAGNKNTSAWTNTASTYTTNRVTPAAVAYNGYIYIAGGCSTAFTVGAFSGGCTAGNEISTVYYAAINPDGSLGTWNNNSAYNLPATRAAGCLVGVGGYLYYAGGEDSTSTATSTVYYNQIGANGTPGSWSTATNGLPAARAWMGCDVFNGYAYITGGLDNTAAAQANVYYSPSLASGGNITSAWGSYGTNFTTARENLSAVTAGGYLYILGGDDKTNPQLDVQFVQLNPSTGSPTGAWAYGTDLPQPVSGQGAFAANGYIYLIGGRTGISSTSCLSTTAVASVNSTGTISRWSTSINNFNTSARFGMGIAFYNGYYYSLGGDDCTNIVSTNPLQQGGERSESMIAQWSKYADLNGNGTPWNFVAYLTNAQNNSIDIEKWSMNYISSFDSGTTPSWGVSTSVSPLPNQSITVINALDGGGTNLKLSRWFMLTFSINMTKSFDFPDQSQPTVSQYELYYSPPSAKRLMHGKDFRDQVQQDLDAHP